MKERIMGKGSIKGRLGKDDQAAETKDPADKSCLAQNACKTQIYTPATHFSKCGFTCMDLDHQICKQTHDMYKDQPRCGGEGGIWEFWDCSLKGKPVTQGRTLK